MKQIILCAIALVIVACSGNNSTPNQPETIQANTCATSGASYVGVWTDTSGNCGQVPNSVVNISPSGAISLPDTVTCQSVNTEGCTTQENNCSYTASVTGGTCTINYTSTSTFSADGSSASAMASLTMECSDGSSCEGSYSLAYTRQ